MPHITRGRRIADRSGPSTIAFPEGGGPVRALFSGTRPEGGPTALLGIDERGKSVWANLRDGRSAHVLIVGSRGTGKSELLRTMMLSLALRATPAEVQVAAIDLTGRELRVVEALPHAMAGLCETPQDAEELLAWLSDEARRRLIRPGHPPEIVLFLEAFEDNRGRFHHSRSARLEDVLRLGPLCGIHVVAAAGRAEAGIPWGARTRLLEALDGHGPGWFRFRSSSEGPVFHAAHFGVRDLDLAVRWIRGERGGYRRLGRSIPRGSPSAGSRWDSSQDNRGGEA
ncbi:MAG TPA: FtsK/SpoIIIE domain-containing protein [Anaerolineales bacterium]|nr:FtsK/SpoIIIE domain-containing protein [Anaerolineales bacterium]